MTELDFERLLAIGLVAVYWLDSLRLLTPREAVVEILRDGRYKVRFGLVGFELGGRRVSAPSFFRPDRPISVARWHLPGDEALPKSHDTTAIDLTGLRRPRAVLGVLCLTVFIVMILAAPGALIAGRKLLFTALCGIGFVVAVAAATWLVWNSETFGLRRSRALGNAVIAVVCLPCAANLLRAATSARELDIVLPDFARSGTDETEWTRFMHRFARVLAAEIAYRDPDSRAGQAAQRMLAQIRRST